MLHLHPVRVPTLVVPNAAQRSSGLGTLLGGPDNLAEVVVLCVVMCSEDVHIMTLRIFAAALTSSLCEFLAAGS